MAQEIKQVKNGQLILTVPHSWADIWINGQKMGRTGQSGPISLPPGTHELRLENDFALPYKKRFTIVSGEQKKIEASLQRKPATIVVPSQYDKDCVAKLDNKSIGKLGSSEYQLKILDPSSGHALSIECDDEVIVKKQLRPLTPGSTSLLSQY